MIRCKGCNTEFTPSRKGQKYHKRYCFLRATIKLGICPECGIEFKKKFSKQICCSPECANTYKAKNQMKGQLLSCTFCDSPVYKMPSRIRKYNFCDPICRIAYSRSPQNTSMSKNWHHKEEAKQKISEANKNRDYDLIFTNKTRQKLRVNARKTILRADVMEKTRVLNSLRMKGSIMPEEIRQKIRESSPKGKENKAYKGNKASYQAKHMGIHMEGPKVCADYETDSLLCSKRIEKSNKDHKYDRTRGEDWVWRCTRHHRIYDIQHNSYRIINAPTNNPPTTPQKGL